MPQVAQVDDAPAIHLDDKDAVLAALHPFEGIVIAADVADGHVFDRLMDVVPIGFETSALEPGDNLDAFVASIVERSDLRVIGVVMADEDDVGTKPSRPAVRLDQM